MKGFVEKRVQMDNDKHGINFREQGKVMWLWSSSHRGEIQQQSVGKDQKRTRRQWHLTSQRLPCCCQKKGVTCCLFCPPVLCFLLKLLLPFAKSVAKFWAFNFSAIAVALLRN
eukprot:c19840_g2_i1 orf=153-491(+)